MKFNHNHKLILVVATLVAFGQMCGGHGPGSQRQFIGTETTGFVGQGFISGEDGAQQASITPAERLRLMEEETVRAPDLMARYRSNELEPLPMVAHDISVVIAGHRARVVQDMVFQNPANDQLSGEMVVELPDGATPSYLGMFQGHGMDRAHRNSAPWLNPSSPSLNDLRDDEVRLEKRWDDGEIQVDWGELRSAVIAQPEESVEIYEETTRRRIDPAVTEWAGSNRFATRIFPIPGRGFKRVIFAYDRPLRSSDGEIAYRLPLPEDIDADTRVTVHLAGDEYASSELKLGDTAMEAKPTSYGTRWSMTADDDPDGRLILRAKNKNANLQYLVGQERDVPGKLVHVRFRPNVSEQSRASATGRAVFVLDTSYSTKRGLHNDSAVLLSKILQQDDTIAEFAVVAFDVRATQLTNGFVSNTVAERDRVMEDIKRIHLEGATNLAAALDLVQNSELKNGDSYFLLSDGGITWGERRSHELRVEHAALFSRRWLCYSIGDRAVNRQLFAELTRARGRVVQVAASQDLDEAAVAHTMNGARLNGVHASNNAELVVAGDPTWVYPGQYIEVAARVPRNATNLNLTFTVNGQNEFASVPLTVNETTSNIAGRAWAQLYVDRLLDLHQPEADDQALALSQRFSLNNRAASFLILETDEEYVQHGLVHANLNIGRMEDLSERRARNHREVVDGESALGASARRTISSLNALRETQIYDQEPAKTSPVDLFTEVGGDRDDVVETYDVAQELLAEGKNGAALRTISTIVENRPEDDRSLRLAGFVLMDWGMYDEAGDLFARSRAHRSFEPQNYILEGMALTAQGRLGEAALRYEIAINSEDERNFGFDDANRVVAAGLYADLLEAVANNNAVDAATRRAAEMRWKEVRDLSGAEPMGRLVMFWNIDDSDMDLHVTEPGGEEVYYEQMDSDTGGKLYGDNVDGLGPELYEHPTMEGGDYEVAVEYFASTSIEGEAPGATIVAAVTRQENGMKRVRYHATVLERSDRLVQIMPQWSL